MFNIYKLMCLDTQHTRERETTTTVKAIDVSITSKILVSLLCVCGKNTNPRSSFSNF